MTVTGPNCLLMLQRPAFKFVLLLAFNPFTLHPKLVDAWVVVLLVVHAGNAVAATSTGKQTIGTETIFR